MAVLIDWYAKVPLIERSTTSCSADADSDKPLSNCKDDAQTRKAKKGFMFGSFHKERAPSKIENS